MLLKKTILWSCWACHPGRPRVNLSLSAPTPATVSAELRLGVCWNGWSCYLWPCNLDQLLVVDIAPVLAPILPEQKTPSQAIRDPLPFPSWQQRSGQQSLHFPHCLGRPTGPWYFGGVPLSSFLPLFSKPGSIASKSLSLPLILTLLLPPYKDLAQSYQAQIENPG